jgi:hypothetical protein
LRFAAGLGEDATRLRSIQISVAANAPEGSGVGGQAFRTAGSALPMTS